LILVGEVWGLRDYGHPEQIGLEPTPEEYLQNLWTVFDGVKVALKDTGNCFVNLGDTYSSRSGGLASGDYGKLGYDGRAPAIKQSKTDLPDKCLCMIPERFAWGMIERDWILRNKIVWHKPNHMPESVTDRLTKSYEVVYHFVKQQKYYYNLDAIREPHKTTDNRNVADRHLKYRGKFDGSDNSESFGSPRSRTQRNKDKHASNDSRTSAGLHEDRWDEYFNEKGKNPGDVWSINTKPYSKAHFAVFPIELVRRHILAGCPIGGHVLDPFGGSGTVAEFCRKNERNCTLIELNPEYKELQIDRSMANTPELFSF
jgi:DNA modification methylase